MSKPIDIITSALGYSTKNRPEWATSKETQLFDTLMRAMRGLYLVAASVNPSRFGKSAAVNYAAGWTTPADCNSIYYIENGNGDEVIVVPVEQKQADRSRPAIYQEGVKFFGAGNTIDPSGGALTFHYAMKATKPANVNTDFSAEWNTDFDALLTVESAIYMAVQDGRADEAGAWVGSRDSWVKQFVGWLEMETVPRVFGYGASRNYNVNDLIKTLLASVPGQ